MSDATRSPDDVARFDRVFGHLDAVARYARRRGSRQPEDVAAECMTIAWRRLDEVPEDALPWLLGCARRIVLAEWRAAARMASAEPADVASEAPEPVGLERALDAALRALSPLDREALLLIAWDDLTRAQAARALGISQVAFRVRLHRARRRCAAALAAPAITSETEVSHA
jgi:RNA polymerase sigma-70 factor, ECF subfamily